MLTASQKRKRQAALKWAAIAALGLFVFTPKLDHLDLPNWDLPFVSTAVASEGE